MKKERPRRTVEGETDSVLQFRLGFAGAALPLLVLLSFTVGSVWSSQPSVLLFSEGAFLAIACALLLCKDQKRLEKVILDGIAERTMGTIVIAFLLSGILSSLLKDSGLIDGLLWGVARLNISARGMTVITFLATTVISAACGTTNGSIAAVVPILFPTAVSMGSAPGIVMGAVMSGAILGHNIAPVCDTSILSAMTQGTEEPEVVRTRLPYAVVAGSFALILFFLNGSGTGMPGQAAETGGKAMTFVMLTIPAFMIFLMGKGSGLIRSLLLCDIFGILLSLLFGFRTISEMFGEEGTIACGLAGMRDIVIFCILLFIVLRIVNESGLFAKIAESAARFCHTKRQAELAIAGMSIISILMFGADIPAIAAIGPLVKKLADSFHIRNTRSANIMDGIQTAFCGILPYNPGFMIGLQLAKTSGIENAGLSFRHIIPYSYYSIAIIVLILFSIVANGQSVSERRRKRTV